MNKIEYKIKLMKFQSKISQVIKSIIANEYGFLHTELRDIYDEFKIQLISSDPKFNNKYPNINLSSYKAVIDKFMSIYYIDLIVNKFKYKISKEINNEDLKNILPIFYYNNRVSYNMDTEIAILNIENLKKIVSNITELLNMGIRQDNPLKYVIAIYFKNNDFMHKFLLCIYDKIDLTICEDIIDNIKESFGDNQKFLNFIILKNDLSIAKGEPLYGQY